MNYESNSDEDSLFELKTTEGINIFFVFTNAAISQLVV
jgi:hypothetical protein